MSAPQLSLVAPEPAGQPPPAPKGAELEALARFGLRRLIGLRLDLKTPTWNQILFSTAKIPIHIERPPAEVLAAIDQLPPETPPGHPPDPIRQQSEQLLKGLSDSRPRATSVRSIASGPKIPPAHDAVNRWLRRLFLVVTGPEAARLLVAGGYLTPDDVDILNVIYPKGFAQEQKNAVQAAIALTSASMRTGHPTNLPSWLNDQLLTLMDEKRPLDVYKQAYADESKQAPSNGLHSPSTQPNLIAQQTAPSPAADR